MPKHLMRLSSFLIKEIVDVMQQPRLVVTLILGPFLILFLFSMGFTGTQPPVEAIIVVPPGTELPEDLIQAMHGYSLFIPIRDILRNKEKALEILGAGGIDLVAVLPEQIYSPLLEGEQIVVKLLINEIDPMRVGYVTYISNAFVRELNKKILAQAVNRGKQLAPELKRFSAEALDDLILLGEDLEGGDLAQAQAWIEEILEATTYEAVSLESSSQVLLGVAAVMVALGAPPEELERLQRTQGSLQELRNGLEEMKQELDRGSIDVDSQIEELKALKDTMSELQATADLLEQIPTDILISPLATTLDNVSLFNADQLGFYAPAALALLLQHMAVTFGSLTMVRERLLGAEEVFRVAPIAPWEIITGKYMSYSALNLAIGGVLSFLIIRVLGVPLFGNPAYYVMVLVLLTIASLGWGLFVSLLSNHEVLSVQLSMLILLASVFFSGFFLPISGFRPGVRIVSRALPVTYGIQALQDIMLAGRDPAWSTLLPLAALGAGFYVVCTLIYTWQHKKE